MTAWKTEKLGDVCEMIKRGVAPKYIEEGGICVVNQKCVRDHTLNYTLARRHNVELKKVNEERFIQLGDVLVNSTGTGTLGRVAQVRDLPKEPTTVDTHITIVRPIKGMFYNDFFGYMLIKIEKEITEAGEGASGQTELARTKLENDFEVSYPESVDEQKNIVATLDQVFSDIDRAKVIAEKNLENAKELFESYLHEAYSNNDFTEEPLGNIVEVLTDYHANGSYKILKQHVELKETEDYAWMVRSTDFEKGFKNNKRYINESAYRYLKKTPLFGGEIIMSKIGNAGKVYFMPKANRPCSLAMNLFLIRLNPEIANNEYVFRYLNSVIGKKQIKPLLNGAATQTITKDSVRSLRVPLPPLNVQKDVVDKLNEIEKQVRWLENVYQKKLIAIDELQKAILQKAFTGELTKSKGAAA